ncbi:MAG: DUF123 domain-containing protein [Candidatus Nanohalobium sp.]
MKKGSYALQVKLEKPVKIKPGKPEKLGKGFYTYFGSAHGPGGLKRVQRHREVSKEEREVKHWHIDYLTGNKNSEVVEALKFPGKDIECRMAEKAQETIRGFGSTDCGCSSHLAYHRDLEEAEKLLEKLLQKFSNTEKT